MDIFYKEQKIKKASDFHQFFDAIGCRFVFIHSTEIT